MTVPTFPDAKAIVIASESTYESQLNPDADSAASKRSKFIDEMIALAHSLDKKVVLLSMSLPYDAARYNDAAAILAAYSNKKMPVIPEVFNGELRAYCPNYPAAVMTVFGENSPTGKLPVDVYTLGFGLTYQAKTEPEPEETTDTKPAETGKNPAPAPRKDAGPATGDSPPTALLIAFGAAAALAYGSRKRKAS